MTPYAPLHETHATADILANLIAEHFIASPGKANHEYTASGIVSQVVDLEGWESPEEYDNWNYKFWHTYRPACLMPKCEDCSVQLRGVLAITTNTNAEYKYEVTDNFCERYLGWATLSPLA